MFQTNPAEPEVVPLAGRVLGIRRAVGTTFFTSEGLKSGVGWAFFGRDALRRVL